MKKHFSKLTLAIVLALVMGLAFAAPAFANPANMPVGDELLFSITKEVPRDPGTTLPDGTNFWFSITQVRPIEDTGPSWSFELIPAAAERPGRVTLPYQNITFPADIIADGPADGSVAQSPTPINLGAQTWPHAGQFFFVIQEIPYTNYDIDNNPNETLIYDESSFLLIVTVVNYVLPGGGEELRVSNIQVASLLNDNAPVYEPGYPPGTPGTWTDVPGDTYWCLEYKLYYYGPGYEYTPGTPGQPGTWTQHPSEVWFINPYAYNCIGNDVGNDRPGNDDYQLARFYIEKTVVGANRGMADLTTPFEFNATLTVGPVTVAAHFDNATEFELRDRIVAFVQERNAAGLWVDVLDSNGDAIEVEFIGTFNEAAPSVTYSASGFELRDGERLRFATYVPSGTTVSVTEIGMPNWSVDSVYWWSNDGDDFAIVTDPAAPGIGQTVTADSNTLTSPLGHVTSEGGESIEFNNNYHFVEILGLFVGSMPFVAALLAATVLLAMMVASRSRQRIEQLPIAYQEKIVWLIVVNM